METRWCFGYECTLVNCVSYWVGVVAVPLWHPVRSEGFGDKTVLLVGGRWWVPTDGEGTRVETLDAVLDIVVVFRAMQVAWDALSPYEREYRIW